MTLVTSIFVSLIILLVCIYMFVPRRQLDDVTLHRFMTGVSGNVQLTTIPTISYIGKVSVFPFCPISQTIDWKTVLYSFNLEPGNAIIYDHGRWRAQAYTYHFEGTKLYRTDTFTHERELFVEFHLGKNFELKNDDNKENQIVVKPYCEQSGRIPIVQSDFSRFYKTTTSGDNFYQYGYWFCHESGANPDLILCQNQKFDLELVSCRSLTECETKEDNYIWPDFKDSTKYYQCKKGGTLVHGTCPQSNPVFNGLRCINPICKPLVECDNDDCRIPYDKNSFFTCNGMEATKVTCPQGVDSSGINCLYACRGSKTVFVNSYMETLQVHPQKVLVGQTSCINGKVVRKSCDTHLSRKNVIEKGKLYYYWAPTHYLLNDNCIPYEIKISKEEMVKFPLSADPAIASHTTGTGKIISKLIPYEMFASFELDRTHYYNADGFRYKGVLFYFGNQKYVLDEKFLTVPPDTKFVLNNNLNGVWTEKLTINQAAAQEEDEIWIEDKSNDCDSGIEFPGLYYVNKTGQAMCLDGKPTLNICTEHGMLTFPGGCGYFENAILSSVTDKVKEMAKTGGKKVKGTYKGIYSATNSLWYT